MTTILYILLAILMFGVLILVHECGHFITAKKLGVQVNEFAIGMGPVLWKRQKGETQYSIRAFPVGGFCAMDGEDEDNDNPRGFHSVSWLRRVIILVAGSFMNFVAGFLMVAALLSTYSGFTTLELTGFYDNGGLQEQGLQVQEVRLHLGSVGSWPQKDACTGHISCGSHSALPPLFSLQVASGAAAVRNILFIFN